MLVLAKPEHRQLAAVAAKVDPLDYGCIRQRKRGWRRLAVLRRFHVYLTVVVANRHDFQRLHHTHRQTGEGPCFCKRQRHRLLRPVLGQFHNVDASNARVVQGPELGPAHPPVLALKRHGVAAAHPLHDAAAAVCKA